MTKAAYCGSALKKTKAAYCGSSLKKGKKKSK